MWKQRIILASILFLSGCSILNYCTAGMGLGNITTIYNTGRENAINTKYNGNDIDNPFHEGSSLIFSGGVEGIVDTDQEIDNYNDALQKIIRVIQNVVNYTLGLLGAISVVYLLIHGFMILTAAGDDSKTKKGLKGIKNAFIAIVGIGLSRILIRFILWLITTFTS